MDDRSSLHVKRIKEGLEQISWFRQSGENAWSSNFKAWKDRVRQSLAEVFGDEHDYTIRFKRLSFWLMRMQMGQARWERRDQEKFESDLYLAEQLLTDCLEEIGVAPPATETESGKPPKGHASPVIVNVTNILSQTMNVQINE